MKAWKLYGIGDLRYEDCGMPLPGEGEVLLKVKAAGICGSDAPRVFDTGAHRHPLVIGHEFSGTVETVGPGVDGSWLHRRVGVFPLIPCGKCGPCLGGLYEMCRNYDYLGSRRDGGFAEYVRVPARNLIEIPGELSFEEGAMLEPMAVAVHAMRRGTQGLAKDGVVALCGLGSIGLLLICFLRDAGYKNVCAVGNKDLQKNLAVSMGILPEQYCDSRRQNAGAWLRERGADVFFECTGRNEPLSWGIESTRPAGKVVLVGNPFSDMTLKRDAYWKILRNQFTVTGTWNSSFTGEAEDDWHYVLDRLRRGAVNPMELITHCFPLAGLSDGLAVMREKKEDYCKIIVYPGESW